MFTVPRHFPDAILALLRRTGKDDDFEAPRRKFFRQRTADKTTAAGNDDSLLTSHVQMLARQRLCGQPFVKKP
jgi:hypothetical protein